MKRSTRISGICKMAVSIMIVIFLNGCSYPHFYHSPDIQDVPMFRSPGEFSGLVAGSFGSVNPSFEMKGAFSLPGHIAIGGGFMTGGKDNSGDNYDDWSKFNSFEGRMGFYSTFGKNGVFEIYGGYGESTQSHAFAYNDYDGGLGWHWINDGEAQMSASRWFIQPDIGMRNKGIEGAFSLRFSRVSFKEITYKAYNQYFYRIDELLRLKDNTDSWLIEPAFTFRAGAEAVKFQLQVQASLNPSNPDLSFEKFRISTGIHISFGGKKIKPVLPVE